MTDKTLINKHLESIRNTAEQIGQTITLMEICGGHTNIIMKYGLRSILPKNIRLISGPGCPVCVSSEQDIDSMIRIAENDIPIATYGDMLNVPGSEYSLEDIRAKGAKIFEVYSASEVIRIKEKHPDIVFFGIGFETTAPMTAYLLKNKVCVYSVHKLVPPALNILAKGDLRIDGFIDPGHVSTIIGTKPYRKIAIPQVIAGFTPERILRAISILLELIRDKRPIVVNAYPEAVKEDGNQDAQKILDNHFIVADSIWRGLGLLPMSGLEVKDPSLDAKKTYEHLLKDMPVPENTGCRCASILKGLIEPRDCPLYKTVCTPKTPKGACMVSREGSCAISYQYE